MTWKVMAGTSSEHETSDEAVDALMVVVRDALDNVDDEVDPATVDLWRDEATTDLLKRYLDGTEGAGGEMLPTSNLHVQIGGRDFHLVQVPS